MQWAGVSRSLERLALAMAGDPAIARRRWNEGGGLRLTGRADGPGLMGPARIALAFDDWASQAIEFTEQRAACLSCGATP
ncbi:MAG: hypothetical protein WCK21_02230 [Actinomycetota bacterium]